MIDKESEPLLLSQVDVEKSSSYLRVDMNPGQKAHLPKIQLETLSPTGTKIVLGITYTVFALALCMGISGRSENERRVILHQVQCNETTTLWESCFTDVDRVAGTFKWEGYINGVYNLIGTVSLKLYFYNLSTNATNLLPESINYDVTVDGCIYNDHCMSSVENVNAHSWDKVLETESTKAALQYHGVNKLGYRIFNFFQNQETLPNQGEVTAYKVKVFFDSNDPAFRDVILSSRYEFTYDANTTPLAARVGQCVLMFLTVVFLVVWTSVLGGLRAWNQWLPERRWLFVFLIGLLIYLDPVYTVAQWFSNELYSKAAFLSEVCEVVGEVCFLLVLLLMADGLAYSGRKLCIRRFYMPKIALAAGVFMCSICMTILSYPALYSGRDTSPLLCVADWGYTLQVMYVTSGLLVLFLLTVWFVWLIACVTNTGRVLRRLPYLQTRFQQLPYRFFVMQATLFAAVIIFEYAYAIYKLAKPSEATSIELIADDLNTLLRMQIRPFGKMLFVSTYVFLLLFMYLPPGSHLKHLQAKYVFSEREQKRRLQDQQAREARRDELFRFGGIVDKDTEEEYEHENVNIFPFCVETACWLMEIAWEAYYDTKSAKTTSGFGDMNLDQHKIELDEFISNDVTDTHVLVGRRRDNPSRLVVAFRGSSSSTHWYHNMRFTQKGLDLETMQSADSPAEDLQKLNDLEDEEDDKVLTAAHATPHDEGGDGSLADLDCIDPWLEDDMSFKPRAVASMILRRGVWTAQKLGGRVRRGAQHLKDGVDMGMEHIKHGAAHFGVGIGHAGSRLAEGVASQLASSHERGAMGWQTDWQLLNAGLNAVVLGKGLVHTGFWDSYQSVRIPLHRALRKAIQRSLADPVPLELYVTGHSLGGALATLASMDFAVNILPRINQRRRHFMLPPIRIGMYNFGSPRVGNFAFASRYDDLIPNCFRVVVDGDIVTGIPRAWYKHVGTEVVVDCAGSLIVDPSFVERAFQTMAKRSLASHSLAVYRPALRSCLQFEVPLTKKSPKRESGSELDFASKENLQAARITPCLTSESCLTTEAVSVRVKSNGIEDNLSYSGTVPEGEPMANGSLLAL